MVFLSLFLVSGLIVFVIFLIAKYNSEIHWMNRVHKATLFKHLKVRCCLKRAKSLKEWNAAFKSIPVLPDLSKSIGELKP